MGVLGVIPPARAGKPAARSRCSAVAMNQFYFPLGIDPKDGTLGRGVVIYEMVADVSRWPVKSSGLNSFQKSSPLPADSTPRWATYHFDCPLPRSLPAQYFFMRSETTCRSSGPMDFRPRRLGNFGVAANAFDCCCSTAAIRSSSFSRCLHNSAMSFRIVILICGAADTLVRRESFGVPFFVHAGRSFPAPCPDADQ